MLLLEVIFAESGFGRSIVIVGPYAKPYTFLCVKGVDRGLYSNGAPLEISAAFALLIGARMHHA